MFLVVLHRRKTFTVIMENSSALSDGSQQANIVSNENAEAMFGADQGETNMVKLVDGKLTPIGDTEDDVVDGQLGNRYSSDEERSLQGDELRGKTYENSDAALQAGGGVDEKILLNDPIAVADITGNPDAGSTVNTGLPSENEPDKNTNTTPTNSFGGWSFISAPIGEMIPQTPGTPSPTQPMPGIPETPPTPPVPGPEIPDLPNIPQPAVPNIQDVKKQSDPISFTSAAPGVPPTNAETVPETRYEGLADGAKASPGTEEGMGDNPATGDSAHPYDVNAKDPAENQPGERPEEEKETQKFPREMADESSITAQDMISGPDRSDQKSTEGLDRKYNDPEAAREMAS